MKWEKSQCMFLYVFVMSFHFLKLSSVHCHLQFISIHFLHFFPLPSICYHFHAVRSTCHLPHCSSVHFLAFHLISFQIHSSCLFLICSSFHMIEQSRMIRVIKGHDGLQNTWTMWVISLSKLLNESKIIRIFYITDMFISSHKKHHYN